MFTRELILLCLAGLLGTACHSSKVEPSSMSASASAPATVSKPAFNPGPKPTEAELREAVVRNYENIVTIDGTRAMNFLVGDFNGDHSEDLAIVVKPTKAKLAELNSEYVNWILEDPHQSEPRVLKSRPAPLTVKGNELLLAVIHGVERNGWRNSQARQTYLLKNAVGDEFTTQTGRELKKESRALPQLRGDVIREKLQGTPGIIFWTGARYAWHPVI